MNEEEGWERKNTGGISSRIRTGGGSLVRKKCRVFRLTRDVVCRLTAGNEETAEHLHHGKEMKRLMADFRKAGWTRCIIFPWNQCQDSEPAGTITSNADAGFYLEREETE